MSKRHNILSRKVASLFQVARKFESVQEFKITFLSSCFIVGDSHVKVFVLIHSFLRTCYLVFLR